MFTGIVECLGYCESLEKNSVGGRLVVLANFNGQFSRKGDSIAVNGCCLTLSEREGEKLSFDLLEETLRRTNLGKLERGSAVNLERAMEVGGRLGGHFVQGHVDTCAEVVYRKEVGPDLLLRFSIGPELRPYMAFKGSVAVNGVSLTVAEVNEESFGVWLIPHTRKVTNLGGLQVGDLVNLEADILAKYVEAIMRERIGGVTEWMKGVGQ